MKTVKFNINYGGYIGCDDEYEIEVDDNATSEEIESAVADEFEEIIKYNCSFEILSIEED